MQENQAKDIIRSFAKAWTDGDIAKAAAYFSDDGELVTPQGTFKGKEQITEYMNWIYSSNEKFTIKETGVGILVQGDFAVSESELTGGMKDGYWKIPAANVIEFKDGKIVSFRNYYDFSLLAQQIPLDASVKAAVDTVAKLARDGF